MKHLAWWTRAWLLAACAAPWGCAQTPVPATACDACVDAHVTDAPPDAATDAATDGSGAGDVPVADAGPQGDAGPLDLQREIVLTTLAMDLTAHTGHARIQLAPAAAPGVAFEVGGLTLTGVHDDATGMSLTPVMDGPLVHIPVSAAATTVAIDYTYTEHNPADFRGANAAYTLLWPYYCGNVFPCHADPAHGTAFALSLTGVPAGQTAVYPPTIPAPAPAYQIAWAVGDYTTVDLGTTPGGTHLTVHAITADVDRARTATAHLLQAFGWYETTLGPYAFGTEAGSVEVTWGPGAYGGMEHHPLWHIGQAAIADELTHFHEAAHGWFGDGIRIACWEDFVLSEGTVNYLAARAMGAVEGDAAEAAVWTRYTSTVGGYNLPAWPDSCHTVDVLRDHLFSQAPYIRGASFYRALERRIGRPMLDAVLHRFFMDHHGQAARLNDLLALVQSMAGYDPTACAVAWLRPATAGVRGPDTCM